MGSVLNAAAVYLTLIILFRISGRRTLSDMTNFDFVLLLVVGDATQQALLGDDLSLTNAILVVATLLLIDVGLSLWKLRSARITKLLEGVPTVLVADGVPIAGAMRHARIQEEDILEAARRSHGLAAMHQIRFAVLEVNGAISIIPNRAPAGGESRSDVP